MALQDAVKKAGPVVLEPIMKVEVTTPEANMGDIIGDLSSRRAQIAGTAQRGNARVITATVPLSELSAYATAIVLLPLVEPIITWNLPIIKSSGPSSKLLKTLPTSVKFLK